MRWTLTVRGLIFVVSCCLCGFFALPLFLSRCPPAEKCTGYSVAPRDLSRLHDRASTARDNDEKNNEELDTDEDNNLNEDIVSDLAPAVSNKHTQENSPFSTIGCTVNDKTRYECVKRTAANNHNEVYFPFYAFLKPTFEFDSTVLKDKDGEEVFELWNSRNARNYAENAPKPKPYDPKGVFGNFGSYTVEGRDRVKCISGEKGVPMSVQWGPDPYYYPIQVAQFALEHYSRNLTEAEPKSIAVQPKWKIAPDYRKTSKVDVSQDENGSPLFSLQSPEELLNPGIFVSLSELPLFVLQLNVKLDVNASFSVTVELTDSKDFYTIDYVQTHIDSCLIVSDDGNRFTYGLSEDLHTGKWRTFTRNILTDVSCAIGSTQERGKLAKKFRNCRARLAPSQLKLASLAVRGHAQVRSVTQTRSAHFAQFLNGADWLLSNQDVKGGWPIPATKSMGDERLKPGWYSAMAQGHAMSVLSRAYAKTKDLRYLSAAEKATQLFHLNASDGGVRNYFLHTYPWYEEYPIKPGSFVLNGFIYSLFGLYDLKTVSNSTAAAKLYSEGLSSLKALLPLYDTGQGTVYDLRHVTLHTAPNLARWDYHGVHVTQLYWLYSIEADNLFFKIANRWVAYARGEKAKHN